MLFEVELGCRGCPCYDAEFDICGVLDRAPKYKLNKAGEIVEMINCPLQNEEIVIRMKKG